MSESIHVVCPDCDAINRVPKARLSESPKCGKCQHAIFSAAPLALSDANFERHVARSGVPVLVDFWAPWCAPCRRMAPAFEAAAGRLEPRVRLAKLDTEANPRTAGQYGIQSIPTLILFHEGRELARELGAMDQDSIVRWAQGVLSR